MERCYKTIVYRTCLNCEKEIYSNVYEDDMGTFCSCPECGGSFDIDLTEKEIEIIKNNE